MLEIADLISHVPINYLIFFFLVFRRELDPELAQPVNCVLCRENYNARINCCPQTFLVSIVYFVNLNTAIRCHITVNKMC